MTKKTAKPQQAAQIGAGSDDAGGMGDDIASAVRIRPLADLVPYVRNARTHDDAQVAQIMGSILEFGFTNPVLADAKGIVAGHGRVMAAAKLYDSGRVIRLPSGRELPKGTVPVLDCTGWSDAQRRAYILADNRLALNADWNYEMLAVELDELRDMEFDLGLLGFDKQELNDLIGTPNEGPSHVEGEDDAPEAPDNPVTKSGDIWLLGDHRLMCGDSTRIDDAERMMGGVLADMVFTDPPYNVAYSGRGENRLGTIKNDDMSDADFEQFMRDVFSTYSAIMRPLAVIYVCHPDSQTGPKLAFEKTFGEMFRKSSTLIWCKQSAGMGWQDYRAQHEPILYGWKPGDGSHYYCGDRSKTTVWQIGRDAQATYVHPTQKPVALPEEAILNSSKAGQIAADLFGGSGSTLIACEKTGRIARLMELDPRYCDVIVRRWQEFTGKDATLDGDGRTFGEIADERIGATA